MPERSPDLGAAARSRLDRIQDPCSVAGGTPMGLDEMGLIRSVETTDAGDVTVNLRLTSPFCHMIAFLQSEAKREVGELDGVRSVTVVGDQGLDWSPTMISDEARARRRLRLDVIREGPSR